MSVGEEEITYGSIMHNSHINFTLKVFGDFTWALYFQSEKLTYQVVRYVLSTTQHELNTPQSVWTWCSSLITVRYDDEKFLPLLNEHNGGFNGKYTHAI